MNLAKLFNFKYLMQNIKKSKMAILLFLSVVPIFTSLIIITTASNNYVPDFSGLGIANIIFMYITPFILSFSLFGYVYKKKSIDFIGSMPISRKSIFATNTIGGIILIVLMQLITLICTLILGAITETTIFAKLAFDIFVYQTIAYIFVFTVANLAMSVSGNVVTQIVTTLLILFTISASVLYLEAWDRPTISLIDEDYRISANYRITHSNNYTAPSLIFNNGEYYYNQVSLIKMIVLSIIYIALGYFLFKNKKLESAGESFASKTTHLVVKGLTLIPFVMILIAAVDSDEWEGILFLMAIIIVYYLIYDLITNKKSKVKENAIALIVSIAVLFGVYSILIAINEDREYEIELSDIKSFNIVSIAYNSFGIDEEIKDISLIERMIYSINKYGYSAKSETVEVMLNLKNGQRKELRIFNVPYEIIEEVLQNTEKVKLSEKAKIKGNSNIKFTEKENEDLKKALMSALENTKVTQIYEKNRYSDYYSRLNIYDYKNHTLVDFECPMEISEEVFDIVTQASNREMAKQIQKRVYRGDSINLDLDNFNVLQKYMPNDFRGYYGEMPDEIFDYIIKNSEKDFNSEYEYIYLQSNGYRFFTNDVEMIANIMKEYYKTTSNRNYDKYYYDDVIIKENVETTTITEPIYINENSAIDAQTININSVPESL